MNPQVARNSASRYMFAELRKRYPDLDAEWLRGMLNAIGQEELRLIRRDLVVEIERAAHYRSGERVPPEKRLITAGRILAAVDRRIQGEQA